MTEHIKRLPVWSRWLRIVHWTLALSIMMLLLTGWLMKKMPEEITTYAELHYLSAAVLIAAMAVRFWLLIFGRSNEQWIALLPDRHRLKQAAQVLAFYLSLGKSPLPKWYTHNPLWSPLYLLFFLAVLIQVISGLYLLSDTTMIAGVSVRGAHDTGNTLLFWFCLLHIVSAFVHDASNKSADISAMINGHRIFFVEDRPSQQTEHKSVSLDELKSKLPSKDKRS